MAITISNLRFSPYSQKDQFKPIFGATLDFQFILPTAHQAGDKYVLGLDYEKVVYPPSRPLCAYSEAFTIDETEAGTVLSMSLKCNTARFRDYVCKIRKPMPITLQLVRLRGNRQETLLLDDILALPSVVDGHNTVVEGDPLAELLDAKLDKPANEGTEGQVLSLDANGIPVWKDEQEIPEQVQADWDESDSTAVSYIKNKPELFSGSYNDLTDKPDLTVYVEKEEGKGLSTNDYTNADKTKLEGIENGAQVNVQADWDASDSTSGSFIQNKPVLATVATTGSYNDLSDKPELVAVATSGDYSDLSNTPDLTVYVEKEEGKGLSTNDFTDTEKNKLDGIEAGAEVNVQADWDESDSTADAFIQNKPVIKDENDYLYFSAGQANSTVRLDKAGTPDEIALEYSIDKQEWIDYSWTGTTGTTITLVNVGDGVYFRAKNTNSHMGKGWSDYHYFALNGMIYASGNIMSLLDKTCKLNEVKDNFCFVYLFSGFNQDRRYTKRLYSAPSLPARILTGSRCYSHMFSACYLSKAPELPATTLSSYCYENMFESCDLLTTAIDFPIAQLAGGCYSNMYKRCNSLTDMPKIPYFKYLAGDCFNSMFSGCTSLVNASDIKVGSLAGNCFSHMFEGCTSLKVAPRITIGSYYDGEALTQMFRNCTSLENGDVFENPIDITKKRVLSETFMGCTKLKYAPKLTGTTPGVQSFIRAFSGCTSLKYVKTTQTSWDNMDWLDGVSATGVFDCPSTLDTSTRDASHVPEGWIVTHGANEPDDGTTSVIEATTTDIYTVCPGSTETGVLTVSSALTLNAYPATSTDIAYCEVVLDIDANATVTAGTNLTIVDTLTAGKRNVCVVRWSGGVARLYVTIVEDLDESSSSI